MLLTTNKPKTISWPSIKNKLNSNTSRVESRLLLRPNFSGVSLSLAWNHKLFFLRFLFVFEWNLRESDCFSSAFSNARRMKFWIDGQRVCYLIRRRRSHLGLAQQHGRIVMMETKYIIFRGFEGNYSSILEFWVKLPKSCWWLQTFLNDPNKTLSSATTFFTMHQPYIFLAQKNPFLIGWFQCLRRNDTHIDRKNVRWSCS